MANNYRYKRWLCEKSFPFSMSFSTYFVTLGQCKITLLTAFKDDISRILFIITVGRSQWKEPNSVKMTIPPWYVFAFQAYCWPKLQAKTKFKGFKETQKNSQWLCTSLLGIKVTFTCKDSLVDGHTRHTCKRPSLNAKTKAENRWVKLRLLVFFFFYNFSENKSPKKPPNYLKAVVTLFSKTCKC